MTLWVRGLDQVDQTVFVGVRVEQTLILSCLLVGHSPLLGALLGHVLELSIISYLWCYALAHILVFQVSTLV